MQNLEKKKFRSQRDLYKIKQKWLLLLSRKALNAGSRYLNRFCGQIDIPKDHIYNYTLYVSWILYTLNAYFITVSWSFVFISVVDPSIHQSYRAAGKKRNGHKAIGWLLTSKWRLLWLPCRINEGNWTILSFFYIYLFSVSK